MRHAGAVLLAAAALTGCGGDDDEPARRPAGATPSEHPGLRVWVAQGCGSCHTLKAAGSEAPIGPELDRTLRGDSRGHIAASIVDPSAQPTAGFGTGAMPEDYAQRMSERELDDLVDFVADSVGAR